MILFELMGSEADPVYQDLQISNVARQYDFLRSVITASIGSDRRFLSQQVIKALNFHAIACLHANAGEYRPWFVTVGAYEPPAHYRVQALMDDFVNFVNSRWEGSDPVWLAAYVLWRLNHIHPFINGNGRTARAICYFVLCVKSGGWLPGAVTLPELITQHRALYVHALQLVDASLNAGKLDVTPLQNVLGYLLGMQLNVDIPDPNQASVTDEPPQVSDDKPGP